ncbi:mechanosensitive ion channel family protein [Breznakiellaceae bacterium SP9]
MENYFVNFWETNREAILSFGLKIGMTVLIVVAGKIVAAIVRKMLTVLATGRLQLDENLAAILKHLFSYGILVICVIMILETFGFNTTSLIALLGAAGVAVGLALKDTLSNIATGIVILLIKPFTTDDFIEVASTSGTVKEVNLFTTVLQTPDGLYISMPNSSVWGPALKNYTRNGRRRMDLVMGISYDDSIEKAYKVMLEIAAAETRFLQDPPPSVMVQSLGDCAINIQLRAWATVDNYWGIYWDQQRNILEKFEAAGLTLPYPQQIININEVYNANNPPPPVIAPYKHNT